MRGVHVPLREALQDAMDRGHVRRNVADLANPPTAKQARSKRARDKCWNREQLRTFLDHCRDADGRLYAVWHLISTTGLRREEVLALRWTAVDLDEGPARHPRDPHRRRQCPRLERRAKTVAGERTVALDAGTITVLQEHLRRQAAERLAAETWSDADEDTDLLFHAAQRSPPRPEEGVGRLHPLADKVACRASAHDLRHTYATLALRAGMPLRVVCERIGHTDQSITLSVYAHALEGDEAAAAKQVATVILG